MMPTLTPPTHSSAGCSRILSNDFTRFRALERLYRRKAAVEALIRCLENYQRSSAPRRTEYPDSSALRKCSLGSARSQI
jgi:hypothetical protein